MNKKEKHILEDLLNQYPELNKDKKKLEKIIDLLKDNNPKIKIDKNFKQELKSRLDSIIEYNRPEKKSFFSSLILVPFFSMFLIMGGVFYIYKDMNLLKQNDINQLNVENINFDVLNSEEDNIFKIFNEDNNVISPEPIQKRNNKIIKKQNSKPVMETMFYDNGNNKAYINSFEEYCLEYNSDIFEESRKKYCIIEEKICMESNYFNNTCKLLQKK